LHVLSLPPAFVLSQDQTLKLESEPFARSHTIDGALHLPSQEDDGSQKKRTTDDCILNSPPLSRQRARKPSSTFLFLSSTMSKNNPNPQPPQNRQNQPHPDQSPGQTNRIQYGKVAKQGRPPNRRQPRVHDRHIDPTQNTCQHRPDDFFDSTVTARGGGDGPPRGRTSASNIGAYGR
jgi:hypothetical protein